MRLSILQIPIAIQDKSLAESNLSLNIMLIKK